MKERKATPIDALFTSKGEVKYRRELSPFYLRPAYQYTHAECGEIKPCEPVELDTDAEQ